jgi:hypothetical protein
MLGYFIKTLGLNGSWKWACKKMCQGHIVRPGMASGTVRYKLDQEGQKRIMWSFPFRSDPLGTDVLWESANMFIDDFNRVDWVIVDMSGN